MIEYERETGQRSLLENMLADILYYIAYMYACGCTFYCGYG